MVIKKTKKKIRGRALHSLLFLYVSAGQSVTIHAYIFLLKEKLSCVIIYKVDIFVKREIVK